MSAPGLQKTLTNAHSLGHLEPSGSPVGLSCLRMDKSSGVITKSLRIGGDGLGFDCDFADLGCDRGCGGDWRRRKIHAFCDSASGSWIDSPSGRGRGLGDCAASCSGSRSLTASAACSSCCSCCVFGLARPFDRGLHRDVVRRRLGCAHVEGSRLALALPWPRPPGRLRSEARGRSPAPRRPWRSSSRPPSARARACRGSRRRRCRCTRPRRAARPRAWRTARTRSPAAARVVKA